MSDCLKERAALHDNNVLVWAGEEDHTGGQQKSIRAENRTRDLQCVRLT
jgi:hypothetical protein